MPLTATREVNVYILSDDADLREMFTTHAAVGWTCALFAKPGEDFSVLIQKGINPIITSLDHVVVSDTVTVQALTREEYAAAYPESPLP